jgi:DNA-binding transcriptional ArsR family regulator
MGIQESIQQNTEEQVAVFGVLADRTRLRLVKLLCRQLEPDALCVNALARLLGVSQSAVSQHLRLLKNIGLVKGERRGYHIHYSVNREILERYRNLVSVALVIKEPDKEGPGEEQYPIRREQDVSDQ